MRGGSLLGYYKRPPRTPLGRQQVATGYALTPYSCNPPETPIKMPKCGSKSPVRNVAYTQAEPGEGRS